jgi:hypothetical protein
LKRLSNWEPSLAELIAGALFIPLPATISPGPGWLPVTAVAILLIPLTAMQEARSRPGGWEPSVRAVRSLALAILSLLAVAEATALALLLHQLPAISQGGLLFRSGALIWAINLLVFALCYWELDGGGPAHRSERTDPPGDFLFPQQTNERLSAGWAPQFLDYLFLAFNTSTAFSPTDTLFLSRPAKVVMMAQATIALLTIGLVIARGVNIIGK